MVGSLILSSAVSLVFEGATHPSSVNYIKVYSDHVVFGACVKRLVLRNIFAFCLIGKLYFSPAMCLVFEEAVRKKMA